MKPNLKINNLEQQLDELQFASCPTETKDPFFWRWTKEGKETLKLFISSLLKAQEKEIEEKLSKIEDIRFEEGLKAERERTLKEIIDILYETLTLDLAGYRERGELTKYLKSKLK